MAMSAAGGLLMVLLGSSAVAFSIDEAAHAGMVGSHVEVGGRVVSGLSRTRVAAVLAEMEHRYASTEVRVDEDATGGFKTDASAIGLRIDGNPAIEEVLATGRRGSVMVRWLGWLRGFGADRKAKLAFTIDRPTLESAVDTADQAGRDAPVEARITIGRTGAFVGIPGRPGQGIDVADLDGQLRTAAGQGHAVRVTAKRGVKSPQFTGRDAEEAAIRAEDLVAVKLPLAADATTASLSSAELRSLVSSVPGRDRLELVVNEAKGADAVMAALSGAGLPPKEPTFGLDGAGLPFLVPGAPGRVCCGPDTGARVGASILRRPSGPVRFNLVDKAPRTTDQQAAAFGVKETVGSFTTQHAPGQPRVTNIHHIADLIRGQVIPPGRSFSINDFVGKRTTEKGFVVDKAIADGEFVEDVGGGVSQFATTLFNAAWFSGLDFGEYQSHSLYISRYPKGRDATLGFPHPDLVIKNPTPYGIVIWPTYTDTSLTVTLYSTHWVTVEAGNQDTTLNGSCTVYTSRRRRTFLDGRVAEDYTKAQYRAAPSQDCGETKPSPKRPPTTGPPPGTPTTTRPRSPTSTKRP